MDYKKFKEIKEKYGDCGSWAIWAEEGNKPKSNVGDISIFDTSRNSSLIQNLKPEFVFVGLNFSKINETTPFSNFHSKSSTAQDFKIRYALRDTKYWGSYMTDIIKNFEEISSKNMMRALKSDQSLLEKNLDTFENELKFLGVENKLIVAFGNDVFEILQNGYRDKYNIKKIPHYSHFMSKEDYREKVSLLI